MIKRLLFLLFLLTAFAGKGQELYRYTIDLKNAKNDKVKVVLKAPKLKSDKAVFVMPRVIPGSYALKEYGRFLEQVKAFDQKGKEMKLTRSNNMFYLKKGAGKLSRIEYFVNDTWDDNDLKNFIFQPGGSNIEENKNFVLNNHAFMGYFEGYKNLPYEVEVIKPDFMFAATWLKKESITPEKDVIKAENYDDLADNPVMYCKPDTASFRIDNTRVIVTNYSATGKIKADSLSFWLQPLANSLRTFLGKLPVDEYYFNFYFATPDQVKEVPEDQGGLSGYGALEHNHASFYFLPEMEMGPELRASVQDIGAHEFLHIVTPLNLHSEQIEDFNFKDPENSRHLWLYEGVTEYFSWLVRVQTGLVTEEEFFTEMKRKLERAEEYKPFSFTEMSKNVLTAENQKNYANVYQKGATIAMLLDQLLITKSEGKNSLKLLVSDLMKKYGQNKPFADSLLFDEIGTMTYPEVREFFKKHVEGTEPLPIAASMSNFGIDYQESKKVDLYYIAAFSLKMNDKQQFQVKEVGGSRINMKADDIFLEINGTPVTLGNIQDLFDKYFQYNTSPDALTIKFLRDGKEVIETGFPIKDEGVMKHVFTMLKGSEKQNMLKTVWLKGRN
jgi:predicted metalloprotease with PDZ domain